MTEKIQSINLDANETAFFARELEYIKAGTYDVLYPTLKATQLIPVSTNAGAGAESITYQQFDQLGMAKVIANYADDLPRADIKGKEFTSPIRSLGASYGYNVQEIRAAQYANRNLTGRKANAARRAIEQKINNIGWFGEAANNLLGIVNHPNVTRVAAPQNAGATSTLWANKTPDEILADMNNTANGIVDLTNGVEAPNTLLMPIDQYTYIASTARSANSDTTILEYFLMNNPFINRVEWVNELKGAAVGGFGVDSNDVMIAYDNNPDKLTLEIPQPFEQFPAQERGLEFLINCHARVGGVIVYYPLSIAIMEGI
jgi:hypothetical protein